MINPVSSVSWVHSWFGVVEGKIRTKPIWAVILVSERLKVNKNAMGLFSSF